MNYPQPTYTLVTKNAKVLTERLSAYQNTLWLALSLEAISDGEYQNSIGSVFHEHSPTDVKNAVKHAVDILDMLDINTLPEYLESKHIIQQWFGNTIRDGKKEYVNLDQQWFVRTWETVKLKKPKYAMITVYQNDARAASSGHDIQATFNGGEKTRPLEHGSKMAGRTKLSASEQQKFMKNLRGRTDDAEVAHKYLEYGLKLQGRLRTTRTEHVNGLVQEILEHSRYVIYCIPATYNDTGYMQRIGVPEALDLLELAQHINRRSDDGITFMQVDTRPFRSVGQTELAQPRGLIANAIANLYMHMRKTEAE